jgi:porin
MDSLTNVLQGKTWNLCRRAVWVFGVLVFGAAMIADGPVQAGEDEDIAESFSGRNTLLGDPGGLRSWLEDRGLSVELVYTSDFFANTRGGMRTNGAREYRGDVSLYLELDTKAAGLWENGTFFVHLQEQHGHGITDKYVGDFQVLSNIDADDFKQVSEFWYRHTFFDQRVWLKLGKQEANEDFGWNGYGGEFLQSSPGFSPTIPLATFPDQDWGVVLGIEPAEWFSINVGMYQGRPDGGRSIGATLDDLHGPMVLVEPAFHYEVAGYPGCLRVGNWWNGDRFDKFDKDDPTPSTIGESHGWYVTFDQEVWSENPETDGDEQGIGLFAQYGWAPEDRSEATEYVGGGIQWTGPLPDRDNDVLGLGAFHVFFSDEADFEEDRETAFELFYKAQVCGWLILRPDIQYIANPGGTANKDAVAVGMRCEVSF